MLRLALSSTPTLVRAGEASIMPVPSAVLRMSDMVSEGLATTLVVIVDNVNTESSF
jgi:hypothetical protein